VFWSRSALPLRACGANACSNTPAQPVPDWARLALACGFYDQAHLVRDFMTSRPSRRARTCAARRRSEPGALAPELNSSSQSARPTETRRRERSRRTHGKRTELETHDLRAACGALSELRIGAETTEADANAAFRALAQFNGCTVGVVRFSGETPWERHGEDELLHVLEGEVEVTILGDGVTVNGQARAGDVLVVPRFWHRQSARANDALFVTGTTELSTAVDPR
jgi:quercetin dioxygenase-like cupin family protein